MVPRWEPAPSFIPDKPWEGSDVEGKTIHNVELILDPWFIPQQIQGATAIIPHWDEMIDHLWVQTKDETVKHQKVREWLGIGNSKRKATPDGRVRRLRPSCSAWDPAEPAQVTANLIDVVLSSFPGRALVHYLLLAFSKGYVQVTFVILASTEVLVDSTLHKKPNYGPES
jgi:hypothetical protein